MLNLGLSLALVEPLGLEGVAIAVAAPNVTSASRKIAVTITRLRPSASASGPTNGAAAAQAKVRTEIVAPTAASLVSNSTRSAGSNGCVAYMSTNAVPPQAARAR